MPLSPRQLFTSEPYAIRSVNAATAENANQLNGLPASSFIQNGATTQASTNFNIGPGSAF